MQLLLDNGKMYNRSGHFIGVGNTGTLFHEHGRLYAEQSTVHGVCQMCADVAQQAITPLYLKSQFIILQHLYFDKNKV